MVVALRPSPSTLQVIALHPVTPVILAPLHALNVGLPLYPASQDAVVAPNATVVLIPVPVTLQVITILQPVAVKLAPFVVQAGIVAVPLKPDAYKM